METKRAILAVVLSFFILLGYQYFFAPTPQEALPPTQSSVEQIAGDTVNPALPAAPVGTQPASPAAPVFELDPDARDIVVETALYRAVIKEQGGGFQSFVLKKFRSELHPDSEPLELLSASNPARMPMLFSLDNAATQSLLTFKADQDHVTLENGQDSAVLTMRASLGAINIVRTLVFRNNSYLVDVSYRVENTSEHPMQISPALILFNKPFAHASQASQFLFAGPSAWINGGLEEIDIKDTQKAPVVLQGQVSWTGFLDNYFMTTVVPPAEGLRTITMQSSMEQEVRTVLSEGLRTLNPHGDQTFSYLMYFGPKELDGLKNLGHDLDRSVDFGWFDILGKPMLWMLNFFYSFIGNYGVAIILLTILIKMIFWPITQRGMKSMKNMQKLQPKMAKLREKYKNDPQQMNQEMMALYKTYKVNPLGGCLPMLIQIPFFFAFYKVLLSTIELRHAPFMLWINDLSAPDRLMIGFDIPYLHGIPVLTLLMGASMYIQQKMTPTTADPMQAKIMQFLPIVFTFIFINFASGLVLYWFVNNLLAILQQYLINRQKKA